MWDGTHHESFGSVVTAINEVLKRIVYIPNDIIIFFCQWLYDILCVILSFPILVYFRILLYFYISIFPISRGFSYPVSFHILFYFGFLQVFLLHFILDLPYPVLFPFRVSFSYPVFLFLDSFISLLYSYILSYFHILSKLQCSSLHICLKAIILVPARDAYFYTRGLIICYNKTGTQIL